MAQASVAVAVEVAGPLRGQVERLVEGVLGWAVVGVGDPVLPPRCVLVDVDGAASHEEVSVPLVLLVQDEDDPVTAAAAGRRADAVVRGVPDAATLTRVVARAAARTGGRAAWCTVGAAAGGVGATTVASALAGLRAWIQGPTLAALSGPTHQPGSPLVGGAELGGPAVWAAATPVVGIDDCRVVGLRDAVAPGDAGPVPLVLERGVVDEPVDVLVARPDRTGLAAAATASGAVVLVGRGPVAAGRCRDAADGRLVVEVPWSARVAAAAAAGRLPADVPGTWLRSLAPVVEHLRGAGS